MSQDELEGSDSPQKTINITNDLEIIPESKKEDSPDRLPLQRPVNRSDNLPEEIPQDPNTARVLAACELPLAVNPDTINAASKASQEASKLPLDNPPSSSPAEKPISATPTVQPSDPPVARPEPKSVKHSSKKVAKKEAKKLSGKLQKSQKESLYEKALKQCGLSRQKSTGKTPKPYQNSVGSSEPIIGSDQKALFLQLRESLLALQKKDAITRQAVEKLQKEKRALEEEKRHKEDQIAKCEKTRATDGTTIAKQEEIIAKLRIDQQASLDATDKIGKNKLEVALAENAKLLELNSLLRGCVDHPGLSIDNLQEFAFGTKLYNRLVTEQNTKEVSQLINKACDDCDEFITQYGSCVKKVKAHMEERHSELATEKEKLNGTATLLKRERVNDQKKILDLQRRLGYAMEEYEQDKSKLIKGDTLMGVDLNHDENYMKCKVDDIMITLKDKILASARENLKDPETNKFINKISMTTSQKGSVDSPKKGFDA